MSKDNLEPGDIIRRSQELGLVMRNDEEDGLLVAYPGMDELIIEFRLNNIEYVSQLSELEKPNK